MRKFQLVGHYPHTTPLNRLNTPQVAPMQDCRFAVVAVAVGLTLTLSFCYAKPNLFCHKYYTKRKLVASS